MRGILFYDEVGAKRNAWFIERMINVANELGSELELVVTSDTDNALSYCDPLPDYAIVRTISPELSNSLEKLNIPIFNNAKTARIANDKYETYLYAKKLGIPVMDTASLKDDESAIDLKLYPRVIKTVNGHGGSEVFLAKNPKECKELLSLHPNRHFISQELSSEPGVDMRVYVLGGEVLIAVRRTSESDFRSNFSLGGSAEITEVDRREKEYAVRIAKELGADLIGIDFIRHNGEWVLNEIEDVVGTRMIYSLTDTDAAEVYIKYVLSKVGQKHK